MLRALVRGLVNNRCPNIYPIPWRTSHAACPTVFLNSPQFFPQPQHFFAAGKHLYIYDHKIARAVFSKYVGSPVGLAQSRYFVVILLDVCRRFKLAPSPDLLIYIKNRPIKRLLPTIFIFYIIRNGFFESPNCITHPFRNMAVIITG